MVCFQAAEPSSAGDQAQGHVTAPAPLQYTGPDEHILHELDLVKAKACLTRVCAVFPSSSFIGLKRKRCKLCIMPKFETVEGAP